jgi:hypothetical protein
MQDGNSGIQLIIHGVGTMQNKDLGYFGNKYAKLPHDFSKTG